MVVSNAAGQLNSYLLTVLRELPATPTTLQSLVVEGHELSPAFAAAVPLYSVDVGANVSDVTLTALPTAATATLTFVPADADRPRPAIRSRSAPRALRPRPRSSLSSPRPAPQRTRPTSSTSPAPRPTQPTPHSVHSASHPGHTSSRPRSTPKTYGYALMVNSGEETVTIQAVTGSISAGAVIAPADADANLDGHQVALSASGPGGEPSLTTVTVTVTSQDMSTTHTYTIAITRPAPEPGGFKQIDAGWTGACAVRVDGSPVCWYYDVPRTVDLSGARRDNHLIAELQPESGDLLEIQRWQEYCVWSTCGWCRRVLGQFE